MAELTFLIPIAPYHADIVQRAIDSVLNQTIPCDYRVIEDSESRGAGWARNRLLDNVDSPFVSFLDADDTIEPDFAEQCFRVWLNVNQKNRYVYTNWFNGEKIIVPESPCDMWTTITRNVPPVDANFEDWKQTGNTWQKKTWHVITTFIPADYVRRIGGFDELLEGAEDTDFYWRLKVSGICGIHLNAPLFNYLGGFGSRSQKMRSDLILDKESERYFRRYEGLKIMCCGDPSDIPNKPSNEQQPGDVLLQALWQGNRFERGKATGRIYPYASYPLTFYGSPEDAAKSPHLFARVTSAESVRAGGEALMPRYQNKNAMPAVEVFSWERGADAVLGGDMPMPATNVPQPSQETKNYYQPMVNERPKADVLQAAQRAVKK